MVCPLFLRLRLKKPSATTALDTKMPSGNRAAPPQPTSAVMISKYLNPYTDFGFKKLFGEEASKDLLLDFLNQLLP